MLLFKTYATLFIRKNTISLYDYISRFHKKAPIVGSFFLTSNSKIPNHFYKENIGIFVPLLKAKIRGNLYISALHL